MNFGQAIEALKAKKKVARAGWNGKGMWLTLVPAQDYGFSEMVSFVAIKTVLNSFSPWQPSNGDMLAEDWAIVE